VTDKWFLRVYYLLHNDTETHLVSVLLLNSLFFGQTLYICIWRYLCFFNWTIIFLCSNGGCDRRPAELFTANHVYEVVWELDLVVFIVLRLVYYDAVSVSETKPFSDSGSNDQQVSWLLVMLFWCMDWMEVVFSDNDEVVFWDWIQSLNRNTLLILVQDFDSSSVSSNYRVIGREITISFRHFDFRGLLVARCLSRLLFFIGFFFPPFSDGKSWRIAVKLRKYCLLVIVICLQGLTKLPPKRVRFNF
jgi:hypothetical protein